MSVSSKPLTRAAVESTLLQGLDQGESTLQPQAFPQGNSCELPDTSWKAKVKRRLKKNRFIYGAWQRYKALRARRAAKGSFGARLKLRLKKLRLVRFLINKKKEPGLVRQDHEMLLQLLQMVTSVSQKCDMMGVNLNLAMQSVRETNSKVASLAADIERSKADNRFIEHRSQASMVLAALQKQMDGLSDELQKQHIDLHTALRQTAENDGERYNSAMRIMTSGHEKMDALSVALQQIEHQQRRCFTTVSGSDAICVQYDWDVLLAVPNSDWRLAMYLSMGGHFEYGTEKLFREVVHEGMAVLDIGANVGIYTLHALKQNAEVYAFEPTPSTYGILRQNIGLNGFEFSDKVHLFNVAASDQCGVAAFQEVAHTCGHNSLYGQDVDSHQIEVKTDRIDHLIRNVRIDCFKLDVEGAELVALQGMEQLLQANKTMIGFVEFAPNNLRRASVDPKSFFDALIAYGFLDMHIINDADGSLTPVTAYEEIEHVDSVNLLLKKGANHEGTHSRRA